MPELEKIGKVLDNKIKGIAESGKKIFADGTVVKRSPIEELTSEQNSLFMKLGKMMYENEDLEKESIYKDIFEEIRNTQQLIDMEMAKSQEKRCQKCGATLSKGAAFCINCGEKVIENVQENAKQCCPACGAEIKEGARFCVKCGANLS